MARLKTVEVTMMSGAKYFVSQSEFETFGVPESAESIMGGYIAGRRGPSIRVNTLADGTGSAVYINPSLIESYTVTYL